MEIIDVACAVIFENNKILACQRRAGSHHSFEWEFPGGKIEKGETAEQCIVREMKEELNVVVKVNKKLSAIEHDYGFKKIHLTAFICEIVDGKLENLEHNAFCWHPVHLFFQLNWSKADEKLFLQNKVELL